jgi:hypothetical protein
MVSDAGTTGADDIGATGAGLTVAGTEAGIVAVPARRDLRYARCSMK